MGRGSIQEWIWRAAIVTLACLLAVLLPPMAGHAAESEGGAEGTANGPANVVLPQILAPMTVQNRLMGYAYLTVALAPSTPDKVGLIREKMPFLQDSFLRLVNRGTIAKTGDTKTVDTEEVKKRLETGMAAILPAGTVSELKIDQVTVALF